MGVEALSLGVNLSYTCMVWHQNFG